MSTLLFCNCLVTVYAWINHGLTKTFFDRLVWNLFYWKVVFLFVFFRSVHKKNRFCILKQRHRWLTSGLGHFSGDAAVRICFLCRILIMTIESALVYFVFFRSELSRSAFNLAKCIVNEPVPKIKNKVFKRLNCSLYKYGFKKSFHLRQCCFVKTPRSSIFTS